MIKTYNKKIKKYVIDGRIDNLSIGSKTNADGGANNPGKSTGIDTADADQKAGNSGTSKSKGGEQEIEK